MKQALIHPGKLLVPTLLVILAGWQSGCQVDARVTPTTRSELAHPLCEMHFLNQRTAQLAFGRNYQNLFKFSFGR